MQNREFEKQVQDKMEELKFTPTDSVWDKVEAGLPEEKKRRRWLLFILCFMFLAVTSLFVWNKFSTHNKYSGRQSVAVNEKDNEVRSMADKNVQDTSIKKNAADVTGKSTNLLQKEKNSNEVTAASGKNIHFRGALKMKIKNADTGLITESNGDAIISAGKKKVNEKAAVKVSVKAPVVTNETDEYVSTIVKPGDTASVVSSNNSIVVTADSMTTIIKHPATDSLLVTKSDTAKKELKENKKTKPKAGWQYGVDFAAGSSAVSNNLFDSKSVYANTSSISATPGSGGPVVAMPNQPSANKAIAVGFYAEKNIASKWKFRTGLNYLYQSNSIKTGARVDSAVNFNFSGNLISPQYYRSGNSVVYTNKFHLLETLLLVQFKNSKHSSLYFEAGPTVAWLLSSNALIYNSNTSSYVTNKEMFNKVMVSFIAGAGFDIAKRSKLPISIGYQFKYSINSVVRPAFARQHFINSLISLKIPLKR